MRCLARLALHVVFSQATFKATFTSRRYVQYGSQLAILSRRAQLEVKLGANKHRINQSPFSC